MVGVVQGRQFVAAQIVVYGVHGSSTFRGVTLMEHSPRMASGSHASDVNIWIDGYPMTITPQTRMLTTSSETTFSGILRKDGIQKIQTDVHSVTTYTAFSSGIPQSNAWVSYQATHTPDGGITTSKLNFWPNHIDAKENKFLKLFTPAINTPNYNQNIPGSIRLKNQEIILILPDKTVQDWVAKLGMNLVPQYQKALPDTTATKLHFIFLVTHPFWVAYGNDFSSTNGVLPCDFGRECYYGRPKRKILVSDVIAMPNGVILIPDRALAELHDQAQLAALLSYSISSVLQKHAYYTWLVNTYPAQTSFDTQKNGWDNVRYFHAFWLQQSEQAIRIGIRQMYLAGYDIREAPFAWAVAQGKPVNNPVIDSKHPDKEIPWYAAYAFNYISHYYKDVDYSKLKRGEKEYQQFLQELYKADPSLPHPKVAAAATK
jgi:hypothetical protein